MPNVTASHPSTMVAGENPIVINLESEAKPVPIEGYAKVRFNFNNLSLINDGFNISFNLTQPSVYSATFYAKDYPNRDSYFLSNELRNESGTLITGNTLTDIANTFADSLLKDVFISSNYYVNTGTGNTVTVVSKVPGSRFTLSGGQIQILNESGAASTGITYTSLSTGFDRWYAETLQNYSLYTELYNSITINSQFGEELDLSDFNRVTEMQLPFNNLDNQHVFDVHDICKSYLSTPKPDFFSPIPHQIEDYMRPFKVKYGEAYTLIDNTNTKKKFYKGETGYFWVLNASRDWQLANDMVSYSGVTSGTYTDTPIVLSGFSQNGSGENWTANGSLIKADITSFLGAPTPTKRAYYPVFVEQGESISVDYRFTMHSVNTTWTNTYTIGLLDSGGNIVSGSQVTINATHPTTASTGTVTVNATTENASYIYIHSLTDFVSTSTLNATIGCSLLTVPVFQPSTVGQVPFLTNSPHPKKTYRGQPELLYFIVPKDISQTYTGNTDITVVGNFDFWDGSRLIDYPLNQYSVIIESGNTGNFGGVWQINVSYDKIGLDELETATGQKLKSAELRMISNIQQFLPFSKRKTYLFPYEDATNRFGVAFLNIMGTYDTFEFIGLREDTFDREKRQLTLPVTPNEDGSLSEGFISDANHSIQITRRIVVNSGFIDQDHFDWLKELLNSTSIYSYTDEYENFLLLDSYKYSKNNNSNEYNIEVTFIQTMFDNGVNV